MVRIDFNRLRFLVIDDNAHMRRILRTVLHGFGTREVYEAEDGAAGLEAFTHYMPDIVLTDWFMPIFDGLELAQMIRQPGANANPYVPIIMLTGHSEKKRVLSARDAGITEFLAKPISAKALYERILNVVANPRPYDYFGPDRRRNVNATCVGPERRKGGKADVMAMAFDDAVDRERRDVGTVVVQQRQAGFRRADFGDRGRDRTRQGRTARDRGLDRRSAGCHRVDQIGIDEQRRQRQHGRRDVRLV
jgi:CheY-like chemotaxis protein